MDEIVDAAAEKVAPQFFVGEMFSEILTWERWGVIVTAGDATVTVTRRAGTDVVEYLQADCETFAASPHVFRALRGTDPDCPPFPDGSEQPPHWYRFDLWPPKSVAGQTIAIKFQHDDPSLPTHERDFFIEPGAPPARTTRAMRTRQMFPSSETRWRLAEERAQIQQAPAASIAAIREALADIRSSALSTDDRERLLARLGEVESNLANYVGRLHQRASQAQAQALGAMTRRSRRDE